MAPLYTLITDIGWSGSRLLVEPPGLRRVWARMSMKMCRGKDWTVSGQNYGKSTVDQPTGPL